MKNDSNKTVDTVSLTISMADIIIRTIGLADERKGQEGTTHMSWRPMVQAVQNECSTFGLPVPSVEAVLNETETLVHEKKLFWRGATSPNGERRGIAAQLTLESPAVVQAKSSSAYRFSGPVKTLSEDARRAAIDNARKDAERFLRKMGR